METTTIFDDYDVFLKSEFNKDVELTEDHFRFTVPNVKLTYKNIEYLYKDVLCYFIFKRYDSTNVCVNIQHPHSFNDSHYKGCWRFCHRQPLSEYYRSKQIMPICMTVQYLLNTVTDKIQYTRKLDTTDGLKTCPICSDLFKGYSGKNCKKCSNIFMGHEIVDADKCHLCDTVTTNGYKSRKRSENYRFTCDACLEK